MHLIVPVAGEGTRFKGAGFHDPKPFIRIAGKRMIEWAFDPIPETWKVHLICKEQHIYNFVYWMEDVQAFKDVQLYAISGPTQGAACTVLAALVGIPPGEPVAVMNGDQWFDSTVFRISSINQDTINLTTCNGLLGLQDFALHENWDGYILTFKGEGKKWSYAKADDNNFVYRVAEKEEISTDATVGFYWFRRAGDLLKSICEMVADNLRVNNEFYLCPVYNELILRHRKRIKIVPVETFYGLGTPEDVKVFEDSR